MNTHAYVIGTERPLVEEFYTSYLDEVRFIEQSTNEETFLVIIDESSDEIENFNRKIIENNHQKGVKVVYFDKKMQSDLYSYIKRECSDKSLIDLIDFDGYSYGRVMNKQFLAASTLKADYLHRRDSDVKILKDTFGYPSEIECKYLGKSIAELKGTKINGIDRFTDDQIVYMAGSGYSGKSDWKADFGVFLDQDIELIGEITTLFKYGKELSEEYMNEIINGNVNVKKGELFLPQRNHPNPICGNISAYKIFKYLPCSTVFSTVGSDNLIRGFLKRLGSPIVYHTNFVYHHFGKERNVDNKDYLLSYWPRMINKLIYYRLIEKLIYDYEKTKRNRLINIDDVDFKNLINMKELTYEYVSELSRECIDSYVEIMSKAKNPKIKMIMDYISTPEFFRATVDNMYQGHINEDKLLKNWQELIEICETYKIPEYGQLR